MNASGFLASEFRFKGKLSVVATAVSCLVMICAICISGGFSSSLRSSVRAIAGDIAVLDTSIGEDVLSRFDGVVGVRPVICASALLKNGDSMEGVLLKATEDGTPGGVRLSSAIACRLKTSVGDTLTAYFREDRMRAGRFVISEVIEDAPDLGGASVVFCNIGDLRRILHKGEDEISRYEVILDGFHASSPERTERVATDMMLSGIRCRTSESMYPGIADWLELIRLNTIVILVLMCIVASFNMISALLIMIFRSTSRIGMLKALGMSNRDISSVFLKVSSRSVVKGMLAGNAASLLLMCLQSATHLVRLDASNYFMPYVPVSVNLPLILLMDVLCFVFIMILQQIPARVISSISPARTMSSR